MALMSGWRSRAPSGVEYVQYIDYAAECSTSRMFPVRRICTRVPPLTPGSYRRGRAHYLVSEVVIARWVTPSQMVELCGHIGASAALSWLATQWEFASDIA